MELAVRIGAPLAVIVGVALFGLNYRKIWRHTTREPWTYILRRNKVFTYIISGVGLTGLVAASYFIDWWLSWLPVSLIGVATFWAHIDWAGIRAGEVHEPTAWRCAFELKNFSPEASQWLQDRLVATEHGYERSNRNSDQWGLVPDEIIA
jgi:hypothetical protein